MNHFRVLFSTDCTLESVSLFVPSDEFYNEKNTNTYYNKPVLLPYENIYQSVRNYSIKVVEDKIKEFIELINGNDHVEKFVSDILSKTVKHFQFINRLKLEKVMILVKSGIGYNCPSEIFEKLVELEYLIFIHYPQDKTRISFMNRIQFYKKFRKYIKLALSTNETVREIFRSKISEYLVIENDNKVLDSRLERIRTLNGEICQDDIRNVFIKYLTNSIHNIECTENSAYSTEIIRTLLHALNIRLIKRRIEPIKYSKLCINITYRGNNMLVEFFGFINNGIYIPIDEYNFNPKEELFAGLFTINIRKFYQLTRCEDEKNRLVKFNNALLYLCLCVYLIKDQNNILGVNLTEFETIINNDILGVFDVDINMKIRDIIYNTNPLMNQNINMENKSSNNQNNLDHSENSKHSNNSNYKDSSELTDISDDIDEINLVSVDEA